MTDRVRLYYADARTMGQEAQDALLADEDRERLATIGPPHRRSQYLAGRALLRFALQRSTGASGQSYLLRTTAEGKPECVEGPAISVAHSGHLVVCAVATHGAVGVDAELPSPRRSVTQIAEQFFAPDEATWIDAGNDERFYMLWVLKEAYLKALGVGLVGGLRALECRIAPPSVTVAAHAGVAPSGLALYVGRDAYVGVVTIGCRLGAVHAERWSPIGDLHDAFGPLQVFATNE